MSDALQKPVEPLRFWFEAAGRYLVDLTTRDEVGADPSAETIIKRSLACSWKRASGSLGRFVPSEGAIVGPSAGRIFSASARFHTSALVHDKANHLTVVNKAISFVGMVADLVANTPELPFLAICFGKRTNYADVLRVTESLNQVHLCSTKAESALTFDLMEVRRLAALADTVGMPVIQKAVGCRIAIDRGYPDAEKKLKQLDSARKAADIDISLQDLVWQMPAAGSGTLTAFREWLKANPTKTQKTEDDRDE